MPLSQLPAIRRSYKFNVSALVHLPSDCAPLPMDGSLEWVDIVSSVECRHDSSSFNRCILVPYETLRERLPFKGLSILARQHGLTIPRSTTLAQLITILMSHDCSSVCSSLHSLFHIARSKSVRVQFLPTVTPLSAAMAVTNPSESVISTNSLVQYKLYSTSRPLPSTDSIRYCGHFRRADVEHTLQRSSSSFALCVPTIQLAHLLAYGSLVELAKTHRLFLTVGMRDRLSIINLFHMHTCDVSCGVRYAVFDCVAEGSVHSPMAFATTDLPITSVSDVSTQVEPLYPNLGDGSSTTEFPPQPLDARGMASIATDWYYATDASAICEKSCAVCGELVSASLVSSVLCDSVDMSVLVRPMACVALRPGCPILYGSAVYDRCGARFMDCCRTCLNALRIGRLPARALANGLWTGDIPAQLSALSFVEKLVISKYRHNACVVEVRQGCGTPGQRKMRANAIIFPQPIAKVYDTLPPPREDLDEILAILFVGPCIPTEPDYKRTPLLVRRNRVVQALEWLIANNILYRDIRISHDNLNGYAEHEPPVGVLHKTSDGLRSGEGMAVYELDGEEGTSTGPCEFVVHGLSVDDMTTMSYDARLAVAMKHFSSGKSMLAIGHDDTPESIYHNVNLYPGLFPWLYPYGCGGFENSYIKTRLHRREHIRHLLMYADRRFQTDEYFPFIAFNQEQIRGSTRGGYLLTERRNFANVVDTILNVDKQVLQQLIDRSAKGEFIKPKTDEEQRCFKLLSIVDHVAAHVPGSPTQRKYQRNQLKSLIMTIGVPIFFITFAPVEFKNPLCMYYCGEQIDLLSRQPVMPHHLDRMRAIASNPVACARFFHLLVSLFVRIILRSGHELPGLFGRIRAYYGTVEAQGRLSLHLHLLLWIVSSLSPSDIRERLLESSEFRCSLLNWLEQCHTGDFSTGSMKDIESRIHDMQKGSHHTTMAFEQTANTDDSVSSSTTSYRDPTLNLPSLPDPSVTSDESILAEWVREMLQESDDIVFRSNQHTRNHTKGCKRTPTSQCKARYPRELFNETIVDPATGAIRFKKQEAWINTFNPLLSYLLRCNTDVTCLLSGTQVKAVIAYVTDYISKAAYKSDSVFSAVKSIVERYDDILTNHSGRHDAARAVVIKIVNALSAMQQVGAPAACAYLLGNPDHYTDQVFKTFYWMSYVDFVSSTSDIQDPHSAEESEDDLSEKVVVAREDDNIVPYYRVNDYIYRPPEFGHLTLYEYMTSTVIRRVRKVCSPSLTTNQTDNVFGENPSQDDAADVDDVQLPHSLSGYRFLSEHPLVESHRVFSLSADKKYVLNFVGPVLPRKDVGDRNMYCKTMLVFFKPGGWRVGTDLSTNYGSWEDVYDATIFDSAHVEIMRNMNVLYECLDARDDYAALRRQQEATARQPGAPLAPVSTDDLTEAQLHGMPNTDTVDNAVAQALDNPGSIGLQRMSAIDSKINVMRTTVSKLYGSLNLCTPPNSSLVPISWPLRRPDEWNDMVKVEKERVVQIRRQAMRVESSVSTSQIYESTSSGLTFSNMVCVISCASFHNYVSMYNIPRSVQDPALRMMHDISSRFSLNNEQMLAFGIVAGHLHRHDVSPLRMYLGHQEKPPRTI